jgi:hypothetical protein
VKILAAAASGLALDGDLLPASKAIRWEPEAMKPTVRLRQRSPKGRLLNLNGG